MPRLAGTFSSRPDKVRAHRRGDGTRAECCEGLCGIEEERVRWMLTLSTTHPDWSPARVRQRAYVLAFIGAPQPEPV